MNFNPKNYVIQCYLNGVWHYALLTSTSRIIIEENYAAILTQSNFGYNHRLLTIDPDGGFNMTLKRCTSWM